ncbi:hypothetical protein EVAR_71211_1 [Eumeta japonica]|uniref:Uncharacterized protein n=1 Tax=Eumeta variegata TaxID=151549 RepID=A0A4C2A313_EUMVA|nr:hypothetical protein EVAR_71211_1 [Eumeta japonica]
MKIPYLSGFIYLAVSAYPSTNFSLKLRSLSLKLACWPGADRGLTRTIVSSAMTTSAAEGSTCSSRHEACGFSLLEVKTHRSIRPWSGSNPTPLIRIRILDQCVSSALYA